MLCNNKFFIRPAFSAKPYPFSHLPKHFVGYNCGIYTLLSQFLTLDITAMQSQMHQYPFHNNDTQQVNNFKIHQAMTYIEIPCISGLCFYVLMPR